MDAILNPIINYVPVSGLQFLMNKQDFVSVYFAISVGVRNPSKERDEACFEHAGEDKVANARRQEI